MGDSLHFGTWTVPSILVIAADPDARHLLATALQKGDFRVAVAADPSAVEEFINTGGVDLLVLDMTLPNQDGLNLCARLRNDGSSLPLIMFSAQDPEQDRILGLNAGADDYLIQPFSARELVARIRALLRRCRARAPFQPACECRAPPSA